MSKKELIFDFLHDNMSSKEDLDLLKSSFDDRIEFLKILFELTKSSDRKVAWRAFWTFEHSVENKNQASIFLNEIIDYFPKYISDGQKRHALKIVLLFEPNEYDLLKVLDSCFKFLNNRAESIAVRVYSMSILYKISFIEPDILSELEASIELNLPDASPGIKNKANKLLLEIRKRL